MGPKTFFFGVMSAFIIMAPGVAAAASPCCDDKACCDKMVTCCKQETGKDATAILFDLAKPAEPVRQSSIVWFHRPVKIGDRILLGKYIIEHDNDRMARGRPCTHIYAADDPRLPVVAFHCRHLTRDVSDRPIVVLKSLGEANGMKELLEFQFAGEKDAHGVPATR
jgi:hypothetical protein